jgi:2-oxoglutarate ferredoxin oxidoreductase subunit gamma
LTDSRYVQITRKVDAKQIELPMYERVMEKIGKPVVFNICVLGALIGITEVIRSKSVMAAVAGKVPKDFVDLNNRAFDLGLVLGAQYGG